MRRDLGFYLLIQKEPEFLVLILGYLTIEILSKT